METHNYPGQSRLAKKKRAWVEVGLGPTPRRAVSTSRPGCGHQGRSGRRAQVPALPRQGPPSCPGSPHVCRSPAYVGGLHSTVDTAKFLVSRGDLVCRAQGGSADGRAGTGRPQAAEAWAPQPRLPRGPGISVHFRSSAG